MTIDESALGEDGMEVRFTIDVSVDRTTTADLDAEVRCKTKSGAETDDASLDHVELSELRPGETTRVTGAAFRMRGLSQVPTRCEIALFADGPSRPIAQVCWNGKGVRLGAC